MSNSLSNQERTILTDYQINGSSAEQRRARIILLHDNDHPVDEIAEATGLSEGTVQQWLRKWDKQHLGIFPHYIESGAKPDDDHTSAPDDTVQETTFIEAADDSAETPDDQVSDDNDQLEDESPIPVFAPRMTFEPRDSMGMLPDEPMAEAGRKAILFHFERMILHEPGSRLGEDVEEVHDMRVATRRMRSAIRLFGPFFKTQAIKPHNHELRQIASTLGTVRDLDVFIEKAQVFAAEHPEHDLTALLKAWNKQRQKTRRTLIKELDSKRFAKFVDTFYAFLTKPGKGVKTLPAAGEPVAYQVRHIAPRLIYKYYEQVRAYEPVLDSASTGILHALRIDFKRFRYALEFFEEVMGPEARAVIEEVKIMQDHLGDLHDSCVVQEALHAFIDARDKRKKGKSGKKRADLSGIQAYLQAKQDEQHHLEDTFPAVWTNFLRDDVRRNLALAVAAL